MGQSSSGQQPTNVRFGVLGFACSLSLLTYLDRVCIMQVKDQIRSALELGAVEMGLILSAFQVGYALFEIPSGWMGDRWGPRKVITRIVIWWSLFTALTGCVWKFHWDSGYQLSIFGTVLRIGFGSFAALMSIRFLFGCGEAGAYPNLTRTTGMWLPFRARSSAQAAVWACARMGGAIAPFIIVELGSLLGWRQAFWVLGLVGVVWAIAFYMWFRDTPDEKTSCNLAERQLIGAGPPGTAVVLTASTRGAVPWRSLLGSLSAWGLGLAAFFFSFGWYFYTTWQPDFLEESFGISFKDSKFLTGLPFLCGAVGCLVGGRVSDRLVHWNRRWGRSLVGSAGSLGAGICVLASGFATTAAQAVVLLCLAFFINDIAIPVIWAACADIGGRWAGTVAGFMNCIGMLGGIISPTLIPVLRTSQFSWRAVFIILASSWFAAALCWLFVDASERLVLEEV